MEYRIAFWTPGNRPAKTKNIFGCASLGMFCGKQWIAPDQPEIAQWKTVQGQAHSGSYAEMLEAARSSAAAPKAIIALFTGGEGNDAFIRSLGEIFPRVPIVGGTSARSDSAPGQVLPDGSDGAILLLENDFAASGRCIHSSMGEAVEAVTDDPRRLNAIRTAEGEISAAAYFSDLRKQLNRPETDFESITLQEPCGRNIHFSAGEGASLHAGSDVTAQLVPVQIPREDAQAAMADFMARPGALSVGCAGLKSLLQEPIEGCEDNVGVFLFGEVVPFADGKSRFSNLMLAQLSPRT